MNGAQDLGGMMGFGPVVAESDEPWFPARRGNGALFALTLAAGASRRLDVYDMSRYARKSLHPADYLPPVAADDPKINGPHCGVHQAAAFGLDRRPQRADRHRWAAGDAGRFHRYAEELLALAPDVVLASATPSVQALRQASRTVPIVFANVGDPVGAGFVDSMARPGGNITGFTN